MKREQPTFALSVGCKVPVTDGATHSHADPRGWQFSLEGSPNAKPLCLRGGSAAKPRANPNPIHSLASAQQLVPVEWFGVRKIVGDGRCLFRALAQGVARKKGIHLSRVGEEMEADNLRMAVFENLCVGKAKQNKFKDVIDSINRYEDPLPKYCKRLRNPEFWGGEPELVVLSKLLKVPVYIYKSEQEFGRSGTGFIKIVEYGTEWSRPESRPVRLLYSGSNHYDLLVDN